MLHIFPAIGIDRRHVAVEHTEKITLYRIASDCQQTAFAYQDILLTDRFQRGTQIRDQIAEPVLGFADVRLILPQRRRNILGGDERSLMVDQIGEQLFCLSPLELQRNASTA